MISITPRQLQPIESAPTFSPLSVSLAPVTKQLTGVDPNTPGLISLVGQYQDLKDKDTIAEGVKAWALKSITGGINALEKKVGASGATVNIGVVARNIGQVRSISAITAARDQASSVITDLSNAIDHAKLDITEAKFENERDIALDAERAQQQVRLTKFRKEGQTEISKIGYINDLTREVESSRVAIDLALATTSDAYANTSRNIATKAGLDADNERNFRRPNELLVVDRENSAKETINALEIANLQDESRIKISSIETSTAIDIAAIRTSTEIEKNNTLLVAQKEALNTHDEGVIETTYIAQNADSDVRSKAAATNAAISADARETDIQVQSATAESALQISTLLTSASTKVQAELKLATANAANEMAIGFAKINAESQINAQRIAADRQLTVQEIAKDRQVQQVALLADEKISNAEMLADAQKTIAAILNEGNILSVEIAANRKESAAKISANKAENLLKITADTKLTETTLAANEALSQTKVNSIQASTVAMIGGYQENALIRTTNIKSHAAIDIQRIKQAADLNYKSDISLAERTAKQVLESEKRSIKISSAQSNTNGWLQTASAVYAGMASKVIAKANKTREHTVISDGGFAGVSSMPILPPQLTLSQQNSDILNAAQFL